MLKRSLFNKLRKSLLNAIEGRLLAHSVKFSKFDCKLPDQRNVIIMQNSPTKLIN